MKIYGDCIAGPGLIEGMEFIFKRNAELLVKQISCIQSDISEFFLNLFVLSVLFTPKHRTQAHWSCIASLGRSPIPFLRG